MSEQTTIKIPKRTHRRLAKAAKTQLPRTSAPRLADAILNAELDKREGGK